MNLYKVNICSAGNGWTDEKSTEGELIRIDGGLCFKYSIDGDECILTVKDKNIVQERSGEQCVKILFVEGIKTECIIGCGGLTGSFEIFTNEIKFISGKCGYRLSLDYLSGCDKEHIKLTFTAVKKGIKNEN